MHAGPSSRDRRFDPAEPVVTISSGLMLDPTTSDTDATAGDPARCGTTLLVASSGGHVDELYRLRQRVEPAIDPVEWVTFDTPQTRSLLRHERVHFVPHVHPKDLPGTAKNAVIANRILRRGRYDRVVSTGAAVAVPYLAAARTRGVAAHYIESAARSDGPSLTGRIVATIPGVRLYRQYPQWTSRRWQFRGSVFDGFHPGDRIQGSIDRVVVTFGTQSRYGFRTAARRLADLLPTVCAPDAQILWQTGATEMTGIDVDAVRSVGLEQMAEAIRDADLVICHAGVGSALHALDHGKCPVLLPRSKARDEHTDDHQLLVADELARRGLAVRADPTMLTAGDLLDAARRSVRPAATAPRLGLGDG